LGLVAALLGAAAAAPPVVHAATFTIINNDGPGEGFNDSTPATSVGGNSGTTIGQQRLIAFQYAADIWAARLSSPVAIRVRAQFNPQTCSATSTILGSAGPISVFRDFPGAPVAGTWYAVALANALNGSDLDPTGDDISATFNSSIGTTCPFPRVWYYGLDGNAGSNIDFVSVLLHELGHGLGFLTFVDLTSGAKFFGFDDAFMLNLENHGASPPDYPGMNDAQRVAASTATGNLHWTGANVRAASGVLTAGAVGDHVRMYAPNPAVSGSSVSHWDTALTPNQVMEPTYTQPLHTPVLELPLFQDIGWTLASSQPALVVSPSSDIAASGAQGGPFSPSSFNYTLSAASGSVGYSISGVPSWLTASSLSGTVTTAGTTITFTVNASANSLAGGTYGPTTITFANTSGGQDGGTRTATLTVRPPTCTLGASPATIGQGQSSTLSWTSANATSGTIDNGVGAVSPVASGSRSVSPAQTVTYTGTFTSAGGATATCQTTVTVIPPPTCTLSASPSTIVQGQSAAISWTSTNATGGTITNIGAVGPSGSMQVLPAQTTTYSGTFSGLGGSANCSTGVTVTAPPPTVARAHGFRHPLGSGYLTEANDGDGWRVTKDYTCQVVGNTYNLGEDWIKETGDSRLAPVLSIGNGQVSQAVTSASGLGNYVLIKHDLADPEFIRSAWRTSVVSLYAHLEDFSVAVGDIISIGQQIGRLGLSGASSPFLHLEVRLGPQYVNTTGASAQPDPEGWVDPTRFINAHRNAPLGLVTFNADTKRDILWRNELGTVSMWLMNGAQIQSGLYVGNVPPDWNVVGLGDFNADGKGDVLWRDNTGALALWLMNASQIQSGLALGSVATDWHVVGVGDFNGDGKADVLWRHDSGAHALWLMNGGQIQSGLFLGSVPTDWHIVGIGDFDADGKSDVFWRQDAGALAMWLMDGGQIKSGLLLGSVPIDWHVVGIGDFDGDGKSDVLWRQDGGALAMWLMNGGQIQSGFFLGSVTPDWHIVGVGDFNADGKADVLWRNDSGAVATWLVNGGNIQTGPVVGTVPNDWNILPHPGDRVVGAGPPSGC
jgi:murein DD-endopeptidase MepM/ murein hydrolase activator NlpD